MGTHKQIKETQMNTHNTNSRLNIQKKHSAQPAVWTGSGSCAHGKRNFRYQGPLQLLTPPFLMTSTTKQMRPNGKGGGEQSNCYNECLAHISS